MSNETETIVISRRLAEEVARVLGNYSLVGFYMPPRTGGVLQGCPRGNPPTPYAMAAPAKELYKRYLKEVSPQWQGNAAVHKCDECGWMKYEAELNHVG